MWLSSVPYPFEFTHAGRVRTIWQIQGYSGLKAMSVPDFPERRDIVLGKTVIKVSHLSKVFCPGMIATASTHEHCTIPKWQQACNGIHSLPRFLHHVHEDTEECVRLNQ